MDKQCAYCKSKALWIIRASRVDGKVTNRYVFCKDCGKRYWADLEWNPEEILSEDPEIVKTIMNAFRDV